MYKFSQCVIEYWPRFLSSGRGGISANFGRSLDETVRCTAVRSVPWYLHETHTQGSTPAAECFDLDQRALRPDTPCSEAQSPSSGSTKPGTYQKLFYIFLRTLSDFSSGTALSRRTSSSPAVRARRRLPRSGQVPRAPYFAR